MTVPIDHSVENPQESGNSPRLRVMEAFLEDIEQGIIRVSEPAMVTLGLRAGDIVYIDGERTSLATIWPLPPGMTKTNIILMDGLIRENTGVGLDDRVCLRKANPGIAGSLLLTPVERTSYGPEEIRRIREFLAGRPLMNGDKVNIPLFSRKGSRFVVSGFEPESENSVATLSTDIRIQETTRTSAQVEYTVKYEDVGGLEDELTRIREMIELPLKYPELFARLRVEPPKGVLLYGPPGTGKTLLVSE